MSVFGETQTYGAFDVDNLFRKRNTPNSYEALLETLRPNKTRPNQTGTHQPDSSTTHLSIHSHHTPPLTDICAIFETFCTLP